MFRKYILAFLCLTLVFFGTAFSQTVNHYGIPLREEINIPITDLYITEISISENIIKLRLRNRNAFVKTRIMSVKCDGIAANLIGKELGENITISDRIIIAAKKPCYELLISLQYRDVRIKLSKYGSSKYSYDLNLAELLDPYLNKTDKLEPRIAFIGNQGKNTFIKVGDTFKFHIWDNRSLKSVLINGVEAKSKNGNFYFYQLKNFHFFSDKITVRVVDSAGNLTKEKFTISRNYIKSLLFLLQYNLFFRWSLIVLGLALFIPVSFKRTNRFIKRRKQKGEIERIRKVNEEWHYGREARMLKQKLDNQRYEVRRMSKNINYQKDINDGLKSQDKVLRDSNNDLKKSIKGLNNKLQLLINENDHLKKEINNLSGQEFKSMGMKFSLPTTKEEWMDTLNLDNNFSLKDLKNEMRKLTKLYHPDKAEKLGPKVIKFCNFEMKRINHAYEKLLELKKQ